MTRWPSAKHFASWLGLSPHNRITGGKVISSKTKASANRAAAALRLAANALHRSDSALGAFLRRKKAHLGARAQSHHCHGPQAGQDHLLHAALRPGVRGRRGRLLRESVQAPGPASRKTEGGAAGLPVGANTRSLDFRLAPPFSSGLGLIFLVSGECSGPPGQRQLSDSNRRPELQGTVVAPPRPAGQGGQGRGQRR